MNVDTLRLSYGFNFSYKSGYITFFFLERTIPANPKPKSANMVGSGIGAEKFEITVVDEPSIESTELDRKPKISPVMTEK